MMNIALSGAVLGSRQWDKGFRWNYVGSKGQRSFWEIAWNGQKFRATVTHTADRLSFAVYVKDQSRARKFTDRGSAEQGMYGHLAVMGDFPLWQVNTFDPYADKGKRHAIKVFLRESDAGAFARGTQATHHVERVRATVHEVPGVSHRAKYQMH